MPNQMSPDSRRANFIVDKLFYSGLEEVASKEGVSVGELIRRALEEKFPEIEKKQPVVQIRTKGNQVVNLEPEVWERLQTLLKPAPGAAAAKKKKPAAKMKKK